MSDSAREIQSHRDPITLTRFILKEQLKHVGASGDFTILMQSVQLACKVIANAFAKAGIANLYGVAGEQNASGDVQKKLDVFSNDAFVNCLSFSEKVRVMVSEEIDEPFVVKDCHQGKYCVVFDPLDGSSNIDANVSVGTIFGVFRVDDGKWSENPIQNVLRPGRELVAAGYAIYGPATMMVLTTGDGVNGFTLDPTVGEFILTHPKMSIPEKGKIYSINEGNASLWDAPTKAFIDWCKGGDKPKSLRYIGSMVADIHRTLLYGGIFAYPGDKKSPEGKLRLLYECGPMAMLMEQAGGAATTGTQRILDIVPKALHQRAPIFLGSKADVIKVEECFRQNKL